MRITKEKEIIRDKQIKKYLKEGITQTEIANLVGCSASTVNRVSKEYYQNTSIVDEQILMIMLPIFAENDLSAKFNQEQVLRLQEIASKIKERI